MTKRPKQRTVTGILHVHPRGFGFLESEDTLKDNSDIFIPKHLTANAVDGDRVEAQILAYTPKGPEGKVTAILQRSRTHVAGTVIEKIDSQNARVYVPLLGTSKEVIVSCQEPHRMQEGDRLIMKVVEWNDSKGRALCLHANWIGNVNDPSSDVSASIEEFELRSQFPQEALLQAENHGKTVKSKEIARRRDFRSLECFTIDPDTAKDFDDAVSLRRCEDGMIELGVHIADVSHYVPLGSPLDREARLRANSTYFPGFCLPMLPHELSSELCSLKANVNRLTVSVIAYFDEEGNLVRHEISRSVIKSAKRFTYKEAKAVLDGKRSSKHAETLHAMVKLCHILKKQRLRRGSVEFCLPEIAVHVDAAGEPTQIERIEYDITHQMIEEFMLKANEIVATHLSDLGHPLTYRVHESPSPENLEAFAQLARAFGFRMPAKPEPKDFQALFEEAAGTSYFSQLAIAFIRSMKLAFYSTTNGGHYGLSLAYYCHFTSPIRRYIDLVIHRILFDGGEEIDSLVAIAYHCSERERVSSRAEQSVLLLKKLRLLEKLPRDHLFHAMVTRVKGSGFLFELDHWAVEGFLPLSALPSYVHFDEKTLTLASRNGNLRLTCGTPIIVKLTAINLITLATEWEFVK